MFAGLLPGKPPFKFQKVLLILPKKVSFVLAANLLPSIILCLSLALSTLGSFSACHTSTTFVIGAAGVPW